MMEQMGEFMVSAIITTMSWSISSRKWCEVMVWLTLERVSN